jgi:hypothetical protein
MDELDLLKKDWKEKEKDLPKLSYEEIYKMIWKKSSSYVKWIFYISVIELVFWVSLDLTFKITGVNPKIDVPNFDIINIGIYLIAYPIIFYFIYRFYKNYKTISSTDTLNRLIENILKTRKTVKQYVRFKIIFMLIASCFLYTLIFKYDPNFTKYYETESSMFVIELIIGIVLFLLVAILIVLLFYRLIYGILLKRLHNNYNELKKIEV